MLIIVNDKKFREDLKKLLSELRNENPDGLKDEDKHLFVQGCKSSANQLEKLLSSYNLKV